jgi:surface antigen/pimeloyl-ACP methyl ester carboxylesterase
VTLGRDRIDKDSNPLFTAGTGNEHGTFSWGLVSAIQGNDQGIDGYNDKANVYLSRAIGSGEWDLALTDFVGEAKAQKQKNAIALLPLDLTQKNADGSITTRYEFTPRERAALENARQNGVLLVVAAGNDGGVMSVLGQSSQEFENILTVGSSDGFGRSDYSSYGYGLDILVPGGAIDNPTLSTVGDDIGTMAGTSASAAIAAGMASKVWESNPDLNPTQVIDILTGSAIDLKEPGWDEETGFGVVNLNKAVQLAKETAPQAYIPTPFSNPTTWGLEGLVTPLERATADQFNGKYYDWVSYTIQSGDTLSQIAVDTMGDASPDAYNFIAQHNNIPNPDEIYAGQEIQIPTEVSAPQQQPPTNDNPNVDFNPDNPNVDFNPDDNPNVDFNPDDNPNVDFNPPSNDNPNVDFNPPSNDNPNVDFNPPSNDNPNVDFNPPSNDNPNVDFNPPSNDNPNVDFNPPPVNSINLNGHIVSGNFYPVFQNYQGSLGDPITNVTDYNGVSYQKFENGSIVSSKYGTFPISGAIRQAFLSRGGLEGRLGAPKGSQEDRGDGNVIQYFEHGNIYLKGSNAFVYEEGTTPPKTSPNIGSQLGVTMPNFNLPAYRENNIFWQQGFAPASTHPSSTNLGTALGNCTWYVNGRLQQLGYNTTALNKLRGNASEWDNQAAAAGISMSSTPQVGDIAQWETGHVAVVEKVNTDKTILISESSYTPNSGSAADYLYKTETISASSPSRFIRLPYSGSGSVVNGSSNTGGSNTSGGIVETPGALISLSGTITGKNVWGTTISHQISLKNLDTSQQPNSTKSTWVVIHGMANNKPKGDILDELVDTKNLANAIHDGSSKNDQVWVLDWRDAANSQNSFGISDPSIGASWIDNVATWTATTLNQLGITGSNINLVGHSLGAYVAAEIAAKIGGGVNNIIALDPASYLKSPDNPEGYYLGGGQYADRINFSNNSKWSWGFYGSALGEPNRAKTAKESFNIDFGWQDPSMTHGAVAQLFTNMVNEANQASLSKNFGLNKLNSIEKPWNIDYSSAWEAKLKAEKKNDKWTLVGIDNNPWW